MSQTIETSETLVDIAKKKTQQAPSSGATALAAAHFNGKIAVADFDSADVLAFSIEIGAQGSKAKLGDGQTDFDLGAKRPGIAIPQGEGGFLHYDAEGNSLSSGNERSIPAFVFPRAAFDELLRTGTTQLVTPGEIVLLEAVKLTTHLIRVAGKNQRVDVISLAGGVDPVKLRVLASTDLPLVLEHLGSGEQVRRTILEIDALPKFEPIKMPLKVLEKRRAKEAKEKERAFQALSGDARIEALIERLDDADETLRRLASEELALIVPTDDLSARLSTRLTTDELTGKSSRSAHLIFDVLAKRSAITGHELLRRLAEGDRSTISLDKKALAVSRVAEAMAAGRIARDEGWLKARIAELIAENDHWNAVLVAGRLGSAFEFEALSPSLADRTPAGQQMIYQILRSFESHKSIDSRWIDILTPLFQRPLGEMVAGGMWLVTPFIAAMRAGDALLAKRATEALFDAMSGWERAPQGMNFRDVRQFAPKAALLSVLAKHVDAGTKLPWLDIAPYLQNDLPEAMAQRIAELAHPANP